MKQVENKGDERHKNVIIICKELSNNRRKTQNICGEGKNKSKKQKNTY